MYNQPQKLNISMETPNYSQNVNKLYRLFNPLTSVLPPTLRQSIVKSKK